MKRFAAMCTIGTMLALFAGAGIAVAGSGTSLDVASRANTPVPAAQAVTPVQVVTHASLLNGASGPLGSSQPPASEQRATRREPVRRAPPTSLRVHRPATQRPKGSVRTTPATPGMGLLLRIGTGAGPEFSLLDDDFTCAPSAMCTGRAPPCARQHPAPARDPIACAAALAPRFVTFQRVPPGVTLPTLPTIIPRPADRPARTEARACRLIGRAPDRTSTCLNLERVPCSLAARLRGATACTGTPLGGFRT